MRQVEFKEFEYGYEKDMAYAASLSAEERLARSHELRRELDRIKAYESSRLRYQPEFWVVLLVVVMFLVVLVAT